MKNKENWKVKILFFIAYIPAVIVIFLPYKFSPLWWSMIVILSFAFGVYFCAFQNQFKNGKDWGLRHSLKVFKKKYFFHNITLFFLSVFIFLPLLLFERNQLSFTNSLALTTAIIISFKFFKIEVVNNKAEKKREYKTD